MGIGGNFGVGPHQGLIYEGVGRVRADPIPTRQACDVPIRAYIYHNSSLHFITQCAYVYFQTDLQCGKFGGFSVVLKNNINLGVYPMIF